MIAGESPAAVEAMAMNLIGTVTVSRIGRPVTGLSVVAELQNCSSAMSIFRGAWSPSEMLTSDERMMADN